MGDEGHDGAGAEDAALRAEWRKAFVVLGGAEHLYAVLVAWDTSSVARDGRGAIARLERTCLSLVVKTLRFFLLGALSICHPDVALGPSLVRQSSVVNAPLRSLSMDISAAADALRTAGEVSPRVAAGGAAAVASSDIVPASPAPLSGDTDDPAEAEALSVAELAGVRASREMLSHFDFARMQDVLCRLVAEYAAGACGDESDAIAEACLSLWHSTVLYDARLLSTFTGSKGASAFLCSTLLCKSAFIRKEALHVFGSFAARLSDCDARPRSWLLEHIERGLLVPACTERDCEQWYLLAARVLADEAGATGADAAATRFGSMTATLVEMLLTRPGAEFSQAGPPDAVWIGLARMTTTLLKHAPGLCAVADATSRRICYRSFVLEVFYRCLFDLPEDAFGGGGSGACAPLPRCKTPAARAAAFDMLLAMCVADAASMMDVLMHGMIPLHGRVMPADSYCYDPRADGRRPEGIVGMTNLRNICYLSSIMQQLFMIPDLRSGIFALPEPLEAHSVLAQMQALYGFLALTDRSSFAPRDFCSVYTVAAGVPLDIRVQRDASEYLAELLERLEAQLKPAGNPELIARCLKGCIARQQRCMGGCGSVRWQEEPFLSLALHAKNQRNVASSFEEFMKEEVISGYFCMACGRVEEQKKRAFLATLPPTLIFALSRFEINYETMLNEKINSAFEFPERLNMLPFTREGVVRDVTQHDAAYYEYELVGVVVHRGHANSGHYFSLIRDRDAPVGPAGSPPAWYRFDDSVVSSFDAGQLEFACFGGVQEMSGIDELGETFTEKRESEQNAYQLVYARASGLGAAPATGSVAAMPSSSLALAPMAPAGHAESKAIDEVTALVSGLQLVQNPAVGVDGTPAAIAVASAASASAAAVVVVTSGRGSTDPRAASALALLPATVKRAIWEDNLRFCLDSMVFDKGYFAFVAGVTEQFAAAVASRPGCISATDVDVVTRWGSDFCRGELSHAKCNGALPAFTGSLCRLLSACPSACASVLGEFVASPTSFCGALLSSAGAPVRAAAGKLLAEVVVGVIDAEYKAADGGGGAPPGVELLSVRWFNAMRSLFPEVVKSWRTGKQFWEVFAAVARRSPGARRMLVAHGAVAALLAFALEDKAPAAAAPTPRTQTMGGPTCAPQLEPLLDAVAVLVGHAHTRASAAGLAALPAVDVLPYNAECEESLQLPLRSVAVASAADLFQNVAAGAAPPAAAAAAAGDAGLLSLDAPDMDCLLSSALVPLWVQRAYHPSALHALVVRLCTGDEDYSGLIGTLCVRELSLDVGPRGWWLLLAHFLSVEDTPELLACRVRRSLLSDPGAAASGGSGLLPCFERTQYSRPSERAPFDFVVRLLHLLLALPHAARLVGNAVDPVTGARYTAWIPRFLHRRLYDSRSVNIPVAATTLECEAAVAVLERFEREYVGAVTPPPVFGPPPNAVITVEEEVPAQGVIVRVRAVARTRARTAGMALGLTYLRVSLIASVFCECKCV